MSGIVGHVMYSILGAKVAEERKLPISGVLSRHFSTYVAGAYLGADIQTLPEAICLDTGKEVGYGTVPVDKSPITGGAVRPWTMEWQGIAYTSRDIFNRFYGRSHLIFGWNSNQKKNAIPWDHLPDYLALAAGDALTLFGPGERPLAYLLGWCTHIVGDSMIKSVIPGIDLSLLNGKYTPENRPIQDLVTFHEIGEKELGLRWASLFADLADTPVEPVQLHFMRVGKENGQLGKDFPGWDADGGGLLKVVLDHNRRYLPSLLKVWQKEMELQKTPQGLDCNEELKKKSGVKNYATMVELAEKANFRHALWQMGEAIGNLFETVVRRQPLLQQLPQHSTTKWSEFSARWRKRN